MTRFRIAFLVVAAGFTLLGVGSVASAATQRCSISNNQEGTPGIDNLRATQTTCATARGVGEALRKAARLGKLERRPVYEGRRFACTFRRRSSANGDYFATVCKNASRTVSMRYYATGLVASGAARIPTLMVYDAPTDYKTVKPTELNVRSAGFAAKVRVTWSSWGGTSARGRAQVSACWTMAGCTDGYRTATITVSRRRQYDCGLTIRLYRRVVLVGRIGPEGDSRTKTVELFKPRKACFPLNLGG